MLLTEIAEQLHTNIEGFQNKNGVVVYNHRNVYTPTNEQATRKDINFMMEIQKSFLYFHH